MKLTKAKLKYFIKDEKKAVKEYHKFGLHGLERSERGHSKFLKGLLAKSD